jgi:hypothetical protein
MWDFGFLLARRAPWEMVKGEHLKAYLESARIGKEWPRKLMMAAVPTIQSRAKNKASDRETVKDVFDQLSGRDSERREPKAVSWRKFFAACKQVAIAHREQTAAATIPFEIAAPSSETINSFILEIWFSELVIEANILGIDLQELGFEGGSNQGPGIEVPPLKDDGSFQIDRVIGFIPALGKMRGRSKPGGSSQIKESFRACLGGGNIDWFEASLQEPPGCKRCSPGVGTQTRSRDQLRSEVF